MAKEGGGLPTILGGAWDDWGCTQVDANVSGLRDDIFALAGEFKNVDTRLEVIGNRLTTMEVRIDTFSQQLQENRRDPNFPQPIPTPQ